MSVKIDGTNGIDVAQLRAPDGDPVAMTIDARGKVAFPATPNPVCRMENSGEFFDGTLQKCTLPFATINVGGMADTVNSRLVPKVAGVYRVVLFVYADTAGAATMSFLYGSVHKNGVSVGWSNGNYPGFGSVAEITVVGSLLIEMNGVSDYLELFVSPGATALPIHNSIVYLEAELVSAA